MFSSRPSGLFSKGAYFLRFGGLFLRNHRRTVVQVLLLTVTGVALQMPVPLFTLALLDKVIPAGSTTMLVRLMMVMCAVVTTRFAVNFINDSLTLSLRETLIVEVESALLKHLHDLPLSYFAAQQSTYLQSRVMNDSRALEGVLIRSLASASLNAVLLLAGAFFLAFIDWRLIPLLFVFVIPFVLIRYYGNQYMARHSTELQERTSLASSKLAESFSGIRTLKSFLYEAEQNRLIGAELALLKKVYVKTNMVGVYSTIGTGLVASLSAVAVMWYGAHQVLLGRMSIGALVAALSMLNFFFQPANEFVALGLKINQASASLKRVFEILDEPKEVGGILALAADVPLSLRFSDVSFSYDAATPVLRDLSFDIPSGTKVALVGRSGAGKSTLVNLLLGFHLPSSGEVYIAEQPLRGLSLASLRSRIGIVDQTPFLFSGTIFENVAMSRPGATLDDVRGACQLARIDSYLESLPEQYFTQVGERGIRLSGGQCQRVCLARMFLKSPDILILDEAVSSLDSQSEHDIQLAIDDLVVGRTTITIAHRVSSLVNADLVLVLADGRLVERGSHKQLLSLNGVYADLFREQFQPLGVLPDTLRPTHVAIAARRSSYEKDSFATTL